MKAKTTLLLLASCLLLVFASRCKDKDETSSLCKKLLKQGTANPELLIGEWRFESFSHTKDGVNFIEKGKIDKGKIVITDSATIWLTHTNEYRYIYEIISSNKIKIHLNGSTFINPPDEEIYITEVFDKAICYSIHNNVLYLHFSEAGEQNILVLNKF